MAREAGLAAALRRTRLDAHLSQAELAERAGIDQPMVSVYERGGRAPSWSTFERMLGGSRAVADVVVEFLPEDAFTLSDLGQLVGSTDDDRRRRRLVLDFVGRFGATSPTRRRALIVAAPPPTDDVRWDALLGALAEHLAFHDDVDPPQWSSDPDRFLNQPWYWIDLPSVRRRCLTGTPTAFRRRNVWVDRSDLERR